MSNAVLGTDYTYEYIDKYVRIRIGVVEGTAMIEFYMDNKLIYYKPLKRDDFLTDLDDMVIKKVIDVMKNDKDRWLCSSSCSWVVTYFDNFNYVSRNAAYKFNFEDEAAISLIVMEDANKHTRLHVSNDKGKGKIVCDFDVSTGEDIIKTADEYAKSLLRIAKTFEKNRMELVKSTLNKNIIVD